MSEAADQFLRKHLDDTNGVRWPSGDAARTDVAQTLLGLSCVGICDYWYEFARDLVVNPQPAKPYVRAWNEVAKKDRAYREGQEKRKKGQEKRGHSHFSTRPAVRLLVVPLARKL